MDKMGKYIYGIIPRLGSTLSFDKLRTSLTTSCSGQVNSNSLNSFKVSSEVYNIPYQDIAAVVKDAEIVDFTHMLKDALAKLLVEHQKIIERTMSLGYTIIPMRLGTFGIDEAEVTEILNKGYNLTKHIFEKISDKIEIDVVATWSDFNSIIKEAGEEKEIKEFKEKILSNPKGITVDDQMKVGSILKKALDERRDKFAKEIQDNLKTFCVDFKTHELMDDKMVVNIAFLVDKDKREDFDKKVEELNAKFNEKLNFRCVGPLPPYSFYTLEIKTVKNEEINWAKNKLEILNDITSKDELKKAYQRQAFSTHPDKNPNAAGAEKEFAEVNRAYKILADYCVALEQANPVRDEKSLNGTNQQDKVPFDREISKENVMFVRVRE